MQPIAKSTFQAISLSADCPFSLQYPTYSLSDTCSVTLPYGNNNLLMSRKVLPVEEKASFPPLKHYLFEKGIVFYVYGEDRCQHLPPYMEEVERNAYAIHSLYSNVYFSSLSNPDLPCTSD